MSKARPTATSDQASDGRHASRRYANWPLIIGIIAIQLAVPTLAFFQEPPSRLGWQMYSGIGQLPEINVERPNGDLTDLPFTDVAAAPRPELNWSELLPPFVCAQLPDAIAIDLTYSTGTQSFECE